MKKVYQTIVDKNKGNCMQAVVASLFEYDLDMIPNFIKYDSIENTSSHIELMRFLNGRGYTYSIWDVHTINVKGNLYRTQLAYLTKDILKIDKGINGYWYASVLSKTYPGTGITHAVVINENMVVVHDPNPNNLCLALDENDIVSIVMVSDKWRIDLNNKLITT